MCEWLLHEVRRLGISGATVINCAEGVGHAGARHAARMLKLDDQPVQIILAVTETEAEQLLDLVRAEDAQLDALLSRSRLGSPMVLYRTVAGDAAEDLLSFATEPGTEFFDDGFMSTSRDPVSAGRFEPEFGDAVFMVIRARAGDAALDVSTWSATNSEHEVLFSRGTRLKVIGWDDDKRTLTVETLDPE